VLVAGTSLNVYPAAGLLKKSRYTAEKIIISLYIWKVPYGYKMIRSKATLAIPRIVTQWLSSA